MYATDPVDSLVPIFNTEPFKKDLVQIGTGVFVEYSSQPFLLTAAHVSDGLNESDLYVPAFDSIYPIDGYVGYVDIIPGEARRDDQIDIAYCRLDSRFARGMLKRFKPWPQSRMSLSRDISRPGACSIYGYPASRAKRRGSTHTSESASFRGVLGTDQDYQQQSLLKDQNLIVRFSKKRTIDMNTGTRINPIHPRGMSGGAIFEWPEGAELSKDWSLAKLIGIFHTYKESANLLIGTPLYVLMTAIMLGQMKKFDGVR